MDDMLIEKPYKTSHSLILGMNDMSFNISILGIKPSDL